MNNNSMRNLIAECDRLEFKLLAADLTAGIVACKRKHKLLPFVTYKFLSTTSFQGGHFTDTKEQVLAHFHDRCKGVRPAQALYAQQFGRAKRPVFLEWLNGRLRLTCSDCKEEHHYWEKDMRDGPYPYVECPCCGHRMGVPPLPIGE